MKNESRGQAELFLRFPGWPYARVKRNRVNARYPDSPLSRFPGYQVANHMRQYLAPRHKMPFFFHYNKPASKKHQKPVISFHFRQQCHLVSNVVINVPTKGRIRPQRQPHFIVCGIGNNIEIIDGVAVVN